MAKRRAPCDHEVKENAIGRIIHSKKEKTVKSCRSTKKKLQVRALRRSKGSAWIPEAL